MSWATWQAATKAALDTFLANLNRSADDASAAYAQLWRDREEAAFAEFGGGGTGNVTGPASSTDNAVARFDGTTGKLLQNSGATLDDGGTLTVTAVSSGSLTASSLLTVTGATVNGFTASKISDSTAAGRTLLTAASDADQRTALGLVIGANVQAYSTNLDTVATGTSTNGHVLRRAGGTTAFGTLDHTALSSSTLPWASAGHTASTSSGTRVATWASGTPGDVPLGASGGVQAWDADLDALAGLSTTGFVERTGTATYTARTLVAADIPDLDASKITTGVLGDDRMSVQSLTTAECGYAFDGDLNFDGSATVTVRGNAMAPSSSIYELACDLHADDLTIGNGVTIRLMGFVIRCHTLTIGAAATVVISDDGNAASGTSGGADFGTACTTVRDNGQGATGRNTAGVGTAGGSLTSPAVGGAGGAGGTATSAGGAGGTVAWTSANQALTGWPHEPMSLISLRTITGVSWKTGAGGGAGGCVTGVSGGGGAGGGLAIVCAGAVTLGASASLTIAARGGAGGSATGTTAGGGGGGGGGCVIFRRRRQTLGSGATVTLTAAGGAGGAGIGAGAAGSAGSAGRTFDVLT
jgi:hypothetical protein